LAAISAELVEVFAEFTPGTTGEVVVTVRGATITYDGAKRELSVNGQRAPAPLRSGKQRLRIFCDRQCLEVFASDGLAYVPMPFIPRPDDRALGIKTTGGAVTFTALQVHEVGSIWK
jgi:sucrose-6-phosphate hydrolase SacC (GH32 family)